MALQNNGQIMYDFDGKPLIDYSRGSLLFDGDFRKHNAPFEIIIARSGGTAVINDILYYINSGDIFIFSENEFVSVSKSSNNILYDSLFVFPLLTRKLYEILPTLKKINFFGAHSEKFINVITHYENSAHRIADYLLKIDYSVSDQTVTSNVVVFQQLLSLISEIFENTEYPCDISDLNIEPRHTHKAITIITEYVNNHINEDISLKKLSLISGLNPNYVSNIFKEQTGILLWDYISEKRVNYAKTVLVSNPNDSILSIALKCGFNSCPNFNRVFKKYTGLTPGKFRKANNR